MRKMTRRVLGLLLAITMVISQFAGIGTNIVAAEEKATVTLQDGTFEGDIWNDGIWTISPENWDTSSFSIFTYSSDQYMTKGEKQGETGLKFWSSEAQNVTVLQTVSIPAGTYKVTADFMGEDANIKLLLGGQESEATALTGYNSWIDKSETFVVESDLTSAQIGFSIEIAAEGYGYLDSIEIVTATEEEPEETEKEYAVTATASATSVNVNDVVSLSAKVMYGDEEVTDLSGSELTFWWSISGDNWGNATYTDNSTGKSLATDVTFNAAGTYYLTGALKDADWNVVKEAYLTIVVVADSGTDGDGNPTPEPTPEVTVGLTNGDFETGNANEWRMETPDDKNVTYVVKSDEWATNNTTHFLNYSNNESEPVAFSMSRTITVSEAGSYYLSFRQDGLATESGLAISVSNAGGELTSKVLPATAGWNAWTTVQTDKIEIAEAGDITITIAGTLPAGYWGDFDDFVLSEEVVETITYELEVTASMEEAKVGEKVDLTAIVKKNGETIASLTDSGLKVWWWIDEWNYEDALKDAALSNGGNSGDTLEASVTPMSVGKNYIVAGLETTDGTKIEQVTVAITSIDASTVTASNEDYAISVITDNMEPEAGDTVKLTATVISADGTVVSDLAAAGLNIWWYPDQWITGNEDGLVDTTCSDSSNGNLLSTTVTLPSVGKYYIAAKLVYDDKELVVCMPYTTTPSSSETMVEGTLNVDRIKNLPEEFVMGMDISSIVSEFASGVTYKDFDGNTITNVTEFCEFLAENGITHIRVRVWNNPYDTNGNGYGGGNCDVSTAKTIAAACRAAGIKMLVNFHCSDLWADPGKQQVPKAWAGYTLEQKAAAVQAFIGESLAVIDPNKDTVAMVQVGNETTGAFVGVSMGTGDTAGKDMCTLFGAGAAAVRAYNADVKVMIHVTNPEAGNVTKWAALLEKWAVDYDILGTSYYPYWHGSLSNLEMELKAVKEDYGKEAMVVETSYAYTLEDSDGHTNTVREGKNDEGTDILQPFTVQGQANAIRNVMNAVNSAGGLGVFYWEPAWLTVGDTRNLEGDALAAQIEANKVKWEAYGSGWASSFAAEYDAEDAGLWYGGSAVDNEAMFYPDGTPTQGLRVWNYVKTGAYNSYTTVEGIENVKETIKAGENFALPTTVKVVYNDETLAETVTWNEADKAAVDVNVVGIYTIKGTVTLSKTVNQGEYNGKTTVDAVYTLTVKEPNLITDAEDAGFESGANFIIGGEGISAIPSNETPYAGEGCLHWTRYNKEASTGTVLYNKVITLEAGKYTFEMLTQGYAKDKVTVQILDTEKQVLVTGETVELTGWKNWHIPFVNFELTETTDIMLNIIVESQKDGWGTADELYLYKESEIVKPDEDESEKEEIKPGEDESEKEEVKPGEDESEKEEVKPGEDESEKEEVKPGEDESEKEEVKPGEDESEKEEVKPGEDESEKEEIVPDEEENGKQEELPESEYSRYSTSSTVVMNGKEYRVLTSILMPEIQLVDMGNVIPEDADFRVVYKGEDTENYESAAKAVSRYITGNGGFVVYEMQLLASDGANIEALNGYVNISLPKPAALEVQDGQMINVYRLEADGRLTRCTTTCKDDIITFATNHFSTYIVAVEAIDMASPKTGVENNMVANSLVLLLAASMVLVSIYKKKSYC